MEVSGDRPLLRIGELSQRIGVSDHVLQPVRSRAAPVTEAEQAGWSR